MSQTLTEPTLLAEPPQRAAPAKPPAGRWRVWVKRLVLVVIAIWFADLGISLLFQHTALKARLTSRLSAAFGRPVEVGSYSFSLWSGPVLQARSVTVAEDSRFGQEYFLRAQSLTVKIAWRSLLTGHLELGTVSLSQPSLNLVRDSDGDWNLAEWLPRPANTESPASRTTSAPTSATSVRFRRIEVDEGRVNFKRGDEKLPFAFRGIRGTLETESPGRWRLDLIATPLRAAAIVQQPGTLHLVGHLGGTSSRLRPAALQLTWSGAKVPDVLRLLEGRDYGVRGNLDLSVSAHTEGDSWLMEGNAALAQLHRWDLALRADNPSASIVAKGKLDSDGSRLELTDTRIDTPHSTAQVIGSLDWSGAAANLSHSGLHIVSDGISASDLLAWARAFRPSISDSLALTGFGHGDASLSGWPPRMDSLTFDLPRAELTGNGLRGPVRAGPIDIRYDAKGISVPPVIVTFGQGNGSLRVDAIAKPDSGDFAIHVQGSAAQAREVVSTASRLGWNVARGWDVAGPVRCDLHWQGTRRPWHSELAGMFEWGTAATGASLHAQFLNLPVEQIRGRAEFKPTATHVTLSSAQAFGAHWSGTFDHELSDGWRFALSSDELSAANLDRWLNPTWRESFLARVLPFLNSRSPVTVSPEGVRARGHLTIDQFTLGVLAVKHLRGDLDLDGRHLEFSNVDGQFERGEIGGSLVADLVANPRYEAALDFSAVDLKVLAAEFPSLVDSFGGAASAKVLFTTAGANRSDLIASLECRGTARVANGTIAGITLPDSAAADDSLDDPQSVAASDPPSATATTTLRDASASFTCADGKVEFQDLALRGLTSAWEAIGAVDYSHTVDLRLRRIPADSPGPRIAKLTDAPVDEYRITGSLKSLQIQKIPTRTRTTAEK